MLLAGVLTTLAMAWHVEGVFASGDSSASSITTETGCGDLDEDGIVGPADSVILFQVAAGLISLDTTRYALGDLDQNQAIGEADAIQALNYIAGIETAIQCTLPPPELVALEDDTATDDTTPTFTWSATGWPSDAVFYLQVDDSPDFIEPLVMDIPVSSTNYTVPEEQAFGPGQYFWRIRAIIEDQGVEMFSPVFSFTIVGGMVGDCDGNQTVGEDDISAVIAELFDHDGIFPEDAPGGSFTGSVTGCDANGDGIITIADVTCVILMIYAECTKPPQHP